MNNNKKKIKVYEVKNMLPEIPLPREIDERLGEVHGIHLLIMKCKSGKSNLVANMLCSDCFYGGNKPIFETVYIISPTVKIDKSSQIYLREEMEDRFIVSDDVDNIDAMIQDIINYQSQFDIKDPDNLPPRIALVLDDISGKLKRNSLVTHIFSRYRHYNMTIFLSNQTCRSLPSICRSMATCIYLSSCYSTLERQKILEEWGEYFGGTDSLEKMWDDAVKERFNYLYLKLDDVKPRAFQLGSNGLNEINFNNNEKNNI